MLRGAGRPVTGVSLVEVLVAVAIVSIVWIGALALQSRLLSDQRRAHDHLFAEALLDEVVEIARITGSPSRRPIRREVPLHHPAPPVVSPCLAGAPCRADDVRESSLDAWTGILRSRWPSGTAGADVALTGDAGAATIYWSDRGAAAACPGVAVPIGFACAARRWESP